MSEKLKTFYRVYAAWLDAGAPEDCPFSRVYGLCSNLCSWIGFEVGLYEEMDNQFRKAGLDTNYPFDTHEEYIVCYNMHLNPARVAWVRAHAEENDNV